jgi:uncharacterized membrane protein YccC
MEVEPMKNPTGRLMAAAALIDAGSNLVAQLDKHQVGGAMFLCIIALAVVAVVVVALVLPLRAALTSRERLPQASRSDLRTPRVADNSRKSERQQRRQLSATAADNSRQRK